MKWRHVAWVESDSEPGKRHEIKRRPGTGELGCGCTAYRFSSPKGCKHLRGFQAGERQERDQAVVVAGARAVTGLHAQVPEVTRVTTGEGTFTVRRAITFGRIPL